MRDVGRDQGAIGPADRSGSSTNVGRCCGVQVRLGRFVRRAILAGEGIGQAIATFRLGTSIGAGAASRSIYLFNRLLNFARVGIEVVDVSRASLQEGATLIVVDRASVGAKAFFCDCYRVPSVRQL